ncbi:SDR family oxidoreductase [Georgenia halophila]|uniref:SDR family oxidoreductase n=1 Tax=Georgenia halophila TaxID=620889 RepID=A0ABP8LJY9_9MICO
MNEQDGQNKIVLITGASSGIGRATAERLAADGHTVVLGARRTDRLADVVSAIGRAGGRASARRLDVTDAQDVQAFVDAAVAEHGRVDVLVNNAGIMPLSPLAERHVEEWDRMIDVNVRGLLHGIAATVPVMRDQGGGHVVTVASIGAHEVSPTASVYCATKFAAWAVTEGLRLESDPSLRVTTVSPGVVESELADSITHDETRSVMAAYRAHTIAPEAIARAISYAIAEPADVDVNEVIVRPAAQR